MDNRKLLEEVMAAFNSEAPGHWRVFEIEQVAAEIVRRVEAALAETDEEKATFTEVLQIAKARYQKNPNWKRLEGTPWENDAPVIAAELMCRMKR